MEVLAMQARKQPNGRIGLVIRGKYISIIHGSTFFKWIRVSNHKKQYLTKIINTERLIVSWLNA